MRRSTVHNIGFYAGFQSGLKHITMVEPEDDGCSVVNPERHGPPDQRGVGLDQLGTAGSSCIPR